MSQSPELAGGTGFTFEDAVTATYLTALLQKGYAPGIENQIVCRIAQQQRSFGEPLDDVIVDFRSTSGGLARLGLQVKRSLTISGADSNTEFRDVIRDCWLTLKKPEFQYGVDRFGSAVGEINKQKARDFRQIAELARASQAPPEFLERFVGDGNASKELRIIKGEVVSILAEINQTRCAPEEEFEFFRHLVLIEFDFLHEGGKDTPMQINMLKACLDTAAQDQAPAAWKILCQIAREGAGKSAVHERLSLVRQIALVVKLGGGPSLRTDLCNLTSVIEGPVRFTSVIAQEIGQRLSQAINLMNIGRSGDDAITIQSLSRHLGHADWRKLEQVMAGQACMGADEIEKVATRLGIAPIWLLEGKTTPFCAEEYGAPNGLYDQYNEIELLSPKSIYFVRSKDGGWSNAFIVANINDIRWSVFPKIYPIRSQVGGGGAEQIFEFCCLVRRLSMHRFNPPWRCRGIHLNAGDFNDLIMGRAYPGSLLDRTHEDPWWDDFADLADWRISEDIPYLKDLRSAIITAKLRLQEYRMECQESTWRRKMLEWAGFDVPNPDS